MASLERFFSPSVRFLSTNLKSLPNSRLYFFRANSTTLKATFQDKVGETPNTNPVEADANGIFPPIFLSGLYRVELRDKNNIVQPGWPINNVGQDSAIVPFAPWSEIVTYQEDDVVTSPDGFWFRSIGNGNVGNDPDDNPGLWELIVIPIASNFTTNVPWATWADSGTQITLNIDEAALTPSGREVNSGRGLNGGGDLTADRTINTYRFSQDLTGTSSTITSNFDGTYIFSSASAEHTIVIGAQSVDEGATVTRLICRGGSDFNLIVGASASVDLVWSFDESRSVSSYKIKPGEILELVKVGTNSYVVYAPNGISEIVDLNGNFEAGDQVLCTRNGKSVTITALMPLNHLSNSSPDSAAGAIPPIFRPTIGESNIYEALVGSTIKLVDVTTLGTLTTSYVDYTGSPYSATTAGDSLTISYNINV